MVLSENHRANSYTSCLLTIPCERHGTRTSPILRLGTTRGRGANRTMKNRMVIIAISVATLVASSAMADYWKKVCWSDVSNGPGCYMSFWGELWVGSPYFGYSSLSYNDPCIVYRDGIEIGTLLTNGNDTHFTDYDVVPGVTYNYEIVLKHDNRCESAISTQITCSWIYSMDIDNQELVFDASGGSFSKQTVSVSLYRLAVDSKTSMVLSGVSSVCSDDWMEATMVPSGVDIWVSPNETATNREGTVIISYEGFSRQIKVTQAGKPTTTSYSSWAAANGLSGAWDAKDARGIYNVFRYVFNKPVGDFRETPLMGISFVDGKPVIKTPAIVNSSGFTLSVVASDFVDGTGNVKNYAISASGETRIEETMKPSRFFRLKVNSAQ